MLKGRCGLITGSISGLGLAIAEGLAAQGCNIVLNGIGDAAAGEEASAALARKHGVEAIFHPADLRVRGEIADMVRVAEARFGAVDILVNNAVVRHFQTVEDFPDERWDEALTVNLTAPFQLLKLVLPTMKARQYGRIINMSSVAGLRGIPGRLDYVTTKTALIGMTRVVALETLEDGITCNALCPSSVLTPYSDARIKRMMAEQGVSREEATTRFLAGRQSVNRFVEAGSVAAMIVFLCGPAGKDVTGAALPIDIGWTAGSAIE
jgi:3-hydroxybutyrate dehydrogenase